MMTVGDIRRAIEGLPDEAAILLPHKILNGEDKHIYVKLYDIRRTESRLILKLTIDVGDDDEAEIYQWEDE